MEFTTTQNKMTRAELRKYMEDYLRDHPIDPAWDEECELFDGKAPIEQLNAREYKRYLERNPE